MHCETDEALRNSVFRDTPWYNRNTRQKFRERSGYHYHEGSLCFF